jgi:hypothetical protein
MLTPDKPDQKEIRLSDSIHEMTHRDANQKAVA